MAPSIPDGDDGKLIGVTTEMEYKKEGEEEYIAIAGIEVTGLTAGKYYVRYMKTSSLSVSLDKEVVIPEGQTQEQAAPDASGWVISHANSDTGIKGIIEGLNDTMEYRKLGEEDYTPVTGSSINGLEPGSYQIRYAATDSLKASPPVTVDIRNEAKADREAPTVEGLVITPPTAAGGNDGRIENVTVDMEYRKADQGGYMPVSGSSIEGLEVGSYELRYAGTDMSNPSPAILIVVPDRTKQEQSPPSSAEVKAVNVSAAGAKDGKITGVSPAMEYRLVGMDAGSWNAITGTEVAGLGNGIYEVRYKETATHYEPIPYCRYQQSSHQSEAYGNPLFNNGCTCVSHHTFTGS
ncbi:hypothetical protein Q0F98_39200 [Paenibacillus amylolyticus]|nr:hypothetical protein Q0F98_39200 [Paenibacillus amylolyticus]